MAKITPTPAVGTWHKFTGDLDWGIQILPTPAVGTWHKFTGDLFPPSGWHVGKVVW